jgi:hypothetical protein
MRGEAVDSGSLLSLSSTARTGNVDNQNTRQLKMRLHDASTSIDRRKSIQTRGDAQRDVIWGGRLLRRVWTGSFAPPPAAVEAAAHHVAQCGAARGSRATTVQQDRPETRSVISGDEVKSASTDDLVSTLRT